MVATAVLEFVEFGEKSLVSAVSQTLQVLFVPYATQSLNQLSYTLLFQSPISTSVTKLNTLFKIIFLI